MNRQEIFNKVWNHFIVRNQPFGWDAEQWSCTYHNPPCAIGIFDRDNSIARIGVAITELDEDVISHIFGDDFDLHFLGDLQDTHDGAASFRTVGEPQKPVSRKEILEGNLRVFADRYGLEVPS